MEVGDINPVFVNTRIFCLCFCSVPGKVNMLLSISSICLCLFFCSYVGLFDQLLNISSLNAFRLSLFLLVSLSLFVRPSPFKPLSLSVYVCAFLPLSLFVSLPVSPACLFVCNSVSVNICIRLV